MRGVMGRSAYDAAWAEGRAADWRDAVEQALEPTVIRGAPLPGPWTAPAFDGATVARGGSPLSQRQQEVALLVARGRTNRQIAADLVVSERTVESHVTNVLGKLGLSSRSQIVAWIVGRGLLTNDLPEPPAPLRLARRRRPG